MARSALQLFWQQAGNDPDICGRVILPYPFDYSRPMRFEVVTQLSEEILTQPVASSCIGHSSSPGIGNGPPLQM